MARRRPPRAPLYADRHVRYQFVDCRWGARKARVAGREAITRGAHPRCLVPRRRRGPRISWVQETRAAIRCRPRRGSPTTSKAARGSAKAYSVVAYGNKAAGPERLWWLLRPLRPRRLRGPVLGGIEAWGGSRAEAGKKIDPAEFVPRGRERRHDRRGGGWPAELARPVSSPLVDARLAKHAGRGEPERGRRPPPGRIPGPRTRPGTSRSRTTRRRGSSPTAAPASPPA